MGLVKIACICCSFLEILDLLLYLSLGGDSKENCCNTTFWPQGQNKSQPFSKYCAELQEQSERRKDKVTIITLLCMRAEGMTDTYK